MTPLDKLIERYEQTPDDQIAKGALRIGDCFCVMGMACDIYREDTGQGEWVEGPDVRAFRFRGEMETLHSPWQVDDYFFGPEGFPPDLMDENDGGHKAIVLTMLREAKEKNATQ